MVEKSFETDSGKFLIRPYSVGDEQGVLSLWKAAFNNELSPDVWRWKYLENPYTEKILVCTGEDETILALFGGMPYRANQGGETIEIVHAMDIMSHPDYRGAGLFIKTCSAFMDFYCGPGEVSFLYGFPGKYHYDLGEKYLGYRELQGCLSFLTARTTDLACKKKRFGGRLVRITEVDPSFDHLWEECRGEYPLSVIRDSRFLCWRFIDHPLNKYEIWGYQRWPQKKIEAYAVFSREGEKARLVDMLASSSSVLIGDFLGQIGLEFGKRGVEVVETWLPTGHFLTRAAISAGFVPSEEPLGIILTVRLFDHSPPLGRIAKNIFFTMADGDLL